jgi:hypothetical protein
MFLHAHVKTIFFIDKGILVIFHFNILPANIRHLLWPSSMFLHAHLKTITFCRDGYFGNFMLLTPY